MWFQTSLLSDSLGQTHVGEVSGFSTSISVFASALGPFIFSAATDIFGSYGATDSNMSPPFVGSISCSDNHSTKRVVWASSLTCLSFQVPFF